MPSSHLILCHPLFFLTPIPPSIRVFSNELTLRMRWPKYWSFSFSIIPFKEIPGLISFRMDWLDLLAVQGTLKSLLQHHISKASILWHSAFFIFQLSHPYMTTGKTIALTRQTFVDKVISLLLNMLSRVVLRRRRNRTGTPLSPSQIHWKNIWTLRKFHKTHLYAGRRHQAPRKAAHSLWKEVRENIKDKKRDKRGRDGDPSQEGSL